MTVETNIINLMNWIRNFKRTDGLKERSRNHALMMVDIDAKNRAKDIFIKSKTQEYLDKYLPERNYGINDATVNWGPDGKENV
jgi:hypothetical protein